MNLVTPPECGRATAPPRGKERSLGGSHKEEPNEGESDDAETFGGGARLF